MHVKGLKCCVYNAELMCTIMSLLMHLEAKETPQIILTSISELLVFNVNKTVRQVLMEL